MSQKRLSFTHLISLCFKPLTVSSVHLSAITHIGGGSVLHFFIGIIGIIFWSCSATDLNPPNSSRPAPSPKTTSDEQPSVELAHAINTQKPPTKPNPQIQDLDPENDDSPNRATSYSFGGFMMEEFISQTKLIQTTQSPSTDEALAVNLIQPPPETTKPLNFVSVTSSAPPRPPSLDEDSSEMISHHLNPDVSFEFTPGTGPQCGYIYPDIREVGLPIFKQIIAKDVNTMTNASAQKVARHTKTMLANMMANTIRPIHPLAFFATIKHFESSTHRHSWGWYDFGFYGHLCTSGTCSGYFQVDVGLEPAWSLEGICGSEGLDILGLKGGPDFCAALFWWLEAENGQKCSRMGYNGSNPCLSPGYVWDVSVFERAYLVYGQENQWAKYGIQDSWGRAYSGGWVGGEYFIGYENCASSYHQNEITPASWVQKSVQIFADSIGMPL